MLLELRGPRSLDRPVPAVMRPHRELVDQQRAGPGLEQLHRQQAGHAELDRDPQRHRLCLDRRILAETGGRRDHLPADAVHLHGLHHRVRGALAGRRPGDERGQLPAERHELLGQQRQPVRDDVLDLGRAPADPDALAVVAAADRLEHHRPGTVGERDDVGHRRDRRVARAGHAERAQPVPHRQLVLGVPEGGRPGPDEDALGLQAGQHRRWHVLMIECDNVTFGRKCGYIRQGTMRPDHHVVTDQRRALGRRLGEYPERRAETDRRRRGHPGQLSAADHADGGHAGDGLPLNWPGRADRLLGLP